MIKLERVVQRRLLALAIFIAALWVVQICNWAIGYDLNVSFGLIPRDVRGIDGILGMPLLHGNFPHLISNTAPLVLMGVLLALTATRALLIVNAVIVILGGVLVWVFGNSGVHIGASGLVFGWFGFLLVRGFVDQSLVTLGAALIVGLLYGSFIWGILPGQEGVSWEAHLFGAIAGAAAAIFVRSHVHAPRLHNVKGE